MEHCSDMVHNLVIFDKKSYHGVNSNLWIQLNYAQILSHKL
jgi:hypothetical protein